MTTIGENLGEADRGGVRGRAARAAETLKGTREMLAVLGIVLYGAVRLAYDGFYSKLGVSPDEVGITYLEVISRAALGFTLLAGALVALVAAGIVIFGLILPQTPPYPVESDVRKIATAVGMLFLILALIMVPASLLLGLASLLAAAFVALVGSALAWSGWNAAFSSTERRSLRGLVGLILVCSCVVAVLVGSERWGESKAEIVQRNDALRSQPLIGFLSQRAQLACVHWIGEDMPANLDLRTPLVFLGQSASTFVLYRGGSGPVRLPLAKAAVTAVDSAQTEC